MNDIPNRTTTLPEYEQAIWHDDNTIANREALKWSGNAPPPEIGTLVIVMNRCGLGRITGYFSLDGWLGLTVSLLDPPDWYIKNNGGNVDACVFGPEFRLAMTEGTPSEVDCAALASYAKEHGRSWKRDLNLDWYNARTPAGNYWPGRGNILHALRNSSRFGPSGLERFHLKQ